LEAPRATTLVTEATFGLPVFRFPDREEIERRLVEACRSALDDGETPVLLAYALGKAQESAAILAAAGIATVLHGAAWKLVPVYEAAGFPLPLSRAYETGPALPGEALVVPPNCARTPVVRKIRRRRVVYLSGWAIREAARAEFDADVLLPFSDHADFHDLLAHVEETGASRIVATHGFAADFRAHPRGARPGRGRDPRDRGARGRRTRDSLPGARRHARRRRVLARQAREDRQARRSAARPRGERARTGGEISLRVPFREWEETVTSAGWSTVAKAASAATGWDLATIGASARAIGDLGEAIGLLLPETSSGPPLEIREVDALFRRLAGLRKAAEKQALLEELLRRAAPVEAKYLLKTLSGGLRVGADVTTVEEAVAEAFGADREAVARARRDSGDIGETARAARDERLGEIRFRLFHPIGFMLATPIEEADELGPELPEFAVEDKFDGIRAHAHKSEARAALFSRTLDEVTAQFPEVAAALARLPGSFLLDGEIVAWDRNGTGPNPSSSFRSGSAGRRRPRSCRRRSPRYSSPTTVSSKAPTRSSRPRGSNGADDSSRSRPAGELRLSAVSRAETPEELERLFDAARGRGNEGLVLKRRDSPYQAGKRGRLWRKWKKAAATLDVVVTAVEQGHGKRAGMLSDYTFAVRDGDRFVNIGKAYSGLTDEEIRDLGKRFRAITIGRYGPVRAVSPEVVLEVSFDTLQKSARHKSGFAMRFPRIVRLRPDKRPEDATTLDEVRELYAQLTGR
jgi:DNA ligase-1